MKFSGIPRVTMIIVFVLFPWHKLVSQCGMSTPSQTAVLTGSPSGVWTSSVIVRADTCCGSSAPDKCLRFTIYLDPEAIGINFEIATGAVPPGALYYQINCGPPIAVGSPICLNYAGPHILTFCKPGNNSNSYRITSIPKPKGPDTVRVRDGCSAKLGVSGFSVPTINWTSVPSNTLYNSYLNCMSGCDTVLVTPSGLPPAYVDYEVSGFAASPCQANFFRDTVRVFFHSSLTASITPVNPTICYGTPTAVLTATPGGGLAPYTFSWTTGSTSQSVSVVPGSYTVLVGDRTGCPPTTATGFVTQFTANITANAGPDQTLCKTSPAASLSGSVNIATGGQWSGGAGTFFPSSSSLAVTYSPAALEVSVGTVQLILTTTGNAGCIPGKDTIMLRFQEPPVLAHAADRTVCANNPVLSLSTTVNGFTASPIWSSAGNGTFSSSTASLTTYTPGVADITSGSVSIIVTTTNNGFCPPDADTLLVMITPAPVVNAGIDHTICSNSAAHISGAVTAGASTGSWSTSGDGSFSPGVNALTATYTPGPGDISTGTVSLILTSTNFGNCLAVRDTAKVTIRTLVNVNAGNGQVICSNSPTLNLAGTVTGGTNTGVWSGGTGAFAPGGFSVSAVYSLTSQDITAGFITLTLTSAPNGPCPAVSDSLYVTINNIANLNPGASQTICSSQGTIALSGMITGVTASGSWASSGSGQFNPGPGALNTTYAMTGTDIAGGSLTFSLTSTNNKVCPAVTQTINVSVVKMATVSAGPGFTKCSLTNSVAFSGSVSGAAGSAAWITSGTGMFFTSSAILTPTYILSSSDQQSPVLVFTLVSVNNGPCPQVQDTMRVFITPMATVSAGPNQHVCSSVSQLALSGNVSGGSGTVIWSSSTGGTFISSATNLSPVYSVSPADILSGLVTLTLTSTANGVCPAHIDTVQMRITRSPSVAVVPGLSVCAVQQTFALTGTVTGGGSTGFWSGNGSGSFIPGSSQPFVTYGLSAQDIAAGKLRFILFSSGSAPCPETSDTTYVDIRNLAVVHAGNNQRICTNAGMLQLAGSVAGAAGTGSWITSGTGSFVPGDHHLSATYWLTSADRLAGTLVFSLTSTGNGGCPPVQDTMLVTVKRTPTVNAGPDKTICSNQFVLNLPGIVTGATALGTWNTSGTGAFFPVNQAFTSYSFSPQDLDSKQVTLILSSIDNDVCPAHSDTLRISIVKLPQIAVVVAPSVCANASGIALSAQTSGGSGAFKWSSGGSGTFTPSAFNIKASYLFSPADVAAGNVVLSLSALTQENACGTVSNSAKTTILPSAKADFVASTYTAFLPGDAITFTNLSTNAGTYSWDFGDGGSSQTQHAGHTYTAVGVYTATMKANNQYRCADSTQREILVISGVKFPNAFTPNLNGSNGGAYSEKDYSNDVFHPYTAGVVEYDLMIFNRWGELIFRSNDIRTGWDGYYTGKPCQQDVYVWKADITFFDGRNVKQTGTVTLLR